MRHAWNGHVKGSLRASPISVKEFWRKDFVTFFLGFSFSCEENLIRSGIPVRHIEEEKMFPCI
jgi:uncharacterized protein YcsI (UPF0317 family)